MHKPLKIANNSLSLERDRGCIYINDLTDHSGYDGFLLLTDQQFEALQHVNLKDIPEL